ncbi:MAG: VCBS repeat-containing protein [Sandaracinus sp.]|nr:VCBS repeat-containing protein [Sandaracinus sp.]MCB9612285.1 VCBS repeat-containing protein [Sandaracinus sp.]MCB9621029.1 VCBS repeat-containing protein [Sandaracinus sp.]
MSPCRRFGLLTFFALTLVACDCGGGGSSTCETATDCNAGEVCLDGRCQAARDGSLPDGFVPDGETPDAETCECGGACCDDDELCAFDTCVDDGGPCTTTDDCEGDTYCAAELGRCIPYEVPSSMTRDPECRRLDVAGVFAPTVQCAFTEAPAGDAFPAHLHVLSTPMVADFAIGRGPDMPARPSIVAVFDDGEDGMSELPTGVIRILDGATCTQTAELGSLQLVAHSAPPAIGDLTGDGRPEIVAFQGGGGLVAFTYDAGAWRVLWRSTSGGAPFNVAGGGWAGPSLVDLDDDGVPEVVRGGIVLDATGVVVDASLGILAYSNGIFPVVADVDADGTMELVTGDAVWQWVGAAWALEAWSPAAALRGHVALADFGDFPGTQAWPASTPEVAVISNGFARVQTLDGTVVFGPVALPAGGSGGPPTVADFDGDGRPELASAGARAYSVFDLDCTATPVGTCASARTDGVLWSSPTQDGSSNVTGSSVFDFEDDGRAEVVYGDECFLRVYDGGTGDVVFSQRRSSCTWYENPVIADLDGDFNAEIVIGDNFNCGSADSGVVCSNTASGPGLGPRNTDPLFAGLRCTTAADCVSGSCDAGFCRCTTDAECCVGAGCAEAAFVCEVPPAGTPGAGNTCRASRPSGTRGIRVYRDGSDNWVRSRMAWNQHAYFVTNVEEDGTIPRTSTMNDNWLDPALNNFRQNVPGDAIPGASPDLTTGGTPLRCDGEIARLTARVCNRGTEPVGSGVSVGFYVGDPAAGGERICSGASVGNVLPGECENVECPWPDAPETAPGPDVWVIADDENLARECREGNNVTIFRDVYCGQIF